MDGSLTLVTLSVVDKLAISVLMGTTFIDKCMRSVHRAERKIVPYQFPPVTILTVHEAKSEVEKIILRIRRLSNITQHCC